MDRVAGAIVIGAALIGAAIYARPNPAPPRYEMAVEGAVYRLDNQSGEVILCAQGCRVIASAPDEFAYLKDAE